MLSALMNGGPSFGPTSYPERTQVEKIRVDIIIIITTTVTIKTIKMKSSMAAKASETLAPSGLRIAFEGQVM